jgi:hypothetical protein
MRAGNFASAGGSAMTALGMDSSAGTDTEYKAAKRNRMVRRKFISIVSVTGLGNVSVNGQEGPHAAARRLVSAS